MAVVLVLNLGDRDELDRSAERPAHNVLSVLVKIGHKLLVTPSDTNLAETNTEAWSVLFWRLPDLVHSVEQWDVLSVLKQEARKAWNRLLVFVPGVLVKAVVTVTPTLTGTETIVLAEVLHRLLA